MKRSLGAGKCSSSHLLCSQFSRADNYLRQGSTGASLTLMEADLNEYTQAAGCCNLLRGLYDANVSSALCMCVCHGEAECCSISRMLPPGIEAGVSLQQVSLEVYTLYITSCPATPPKQRNNFYPPAISPMSCANRTMDAFFPHVDCRAFSSSSMEHCMRRHGNVCSRVDRQFNHHSSYLQIR